jgi:hypothetical protein
MIAVYHWLGQAMSVRYVYCVCAVGQHLFHPRSLPQSPSTAFFSFLNLCAVYLSPHLYFFLPLSLVPSRKANWTKPSRSSARFCSTALTSQQLTWGRVSAILDYIVPHSTATADFAYCVIYVFYSA